MNKYCKYFIIFLIYPLVSCGSDVTDTDVQEVEVELEVENPDSVFRQQRIGIKRNNDALTFFDTSTDQAFTPMGYNYTQVQDVTYNGVSFLGHSTFSPDYYNGTITESVLSKLEEGGYNTVRIFIHPALISFDRGSLNQEYVVNIADFIKQADDHHLSVIITTDLAPIAYYDKEVLKEEDVTWLNSQYMNQNEIEIEASFWATLINEFRAHSVPLNAILSYEIRNEFFFHPQFEPFNKNEGVITHSNGQSYDLSLEADRYALVDASFLYWSSAIRNAIQAEDPDALVSVGFFAPDIIGKPSQVAIMDSELDFIDIHLYPSNGTLKEYADYFSLDRNREKLIIMGEFGYVDDSNLTFNQMTDNLFEWKHNAMTNYHVDGWLLWTWDTEIGGRLSVADENNVIFNRFSPNNN